MRSIVIIAVCAFAYLSLCVALVPPIPVDFKSFYLAGRAFAAGANFYDVQQLGIQGHIAGIGGAFPYLYPPTIAILIGSLVSPEPAEAARAWTWFGVAAGVTALAASGALASAMSRPNERAGVRPVVVLSLLLLMTLPFLNNLVMGQSNLMVLALCSLAILCSRRRRLEIAGGGLLAVAISFKATPALLLFYLVLERRFRMLASSVACMVGIVGATMLKDGGMDAWEDFLELAPQVEYGATIPGLFSASALCNFSIAGWMSRVSENAPWVHTGTATTVCGLLAAVVVQHWRMQKRNRGKLLLLSYFVVMVVACPLTYLHHAVLVLPGLLMSTHWLLRERSLTGACLFAASLILASVAGMDWPIYYRALEYTSEYQTSLNLYALLGLFLVGLVVPEIGKGRLT